MDYLDFDIEIGAEQDGKYPVRVLDSPGGQAGGMFRLPFKGLELDLHLEKLENALLRSGGKRRLAPSGDERAVQDFGRRMFSNLMSGDIGKRYAVSLTQASAQNRGLRLKLRIKDPKLAALPWEFLYNPDREEYVSLSDETPIVRYLELPRRPRPLAVELPLRILGMVASPKNLEPLNIELERSRVERALGPLQARGLVELVWLEGETWRDLQAAMRRGPWHVFHFIGHGRFDEPGDEGQIALSDDDGYAHLLPATGLGRLLAGRGRPVLALLNACQGAHSEGKDIFSSTASILVRRGLPAVVAMQYEITDQAAIEFSRSFYEALADGYPVDAAVAEARKAISLAVANTIEWGTPVLYMRAENGVLFNIAPQPPVSRPPTGIVPDEPVGVVEERETRSTEGEPGPLRRWAWIAGGVAGLVVIGVILSGLANWGAGLFPAETQTPSKTPTESMALTETMEPILTATPLPATRTSATAPTGLPPVIVDNNESPMQVIPAGPFEMGMDADVALEYCQQLFEPFADNECSQSWYLDEQPVHTVFLDDYYMDQYEATNQQFAVFLNERGNRSEGGVIWLDAEDVDVRISQTGGVWAAQDGFGDHPVVEVTWYGAKAYCEWRGARLPTEAEWEKAARGDAGQVYPWGDTFDGDLANFCDANCGFNWSNPNYDDGSAGTAPVGSYPGGVSPHGLYDMAGNVWEWVEDWFGEDYYGTLGDGAENPVGPETGNQRVLRGGSWINHGSILRAAYRNGDGPSGSDLDNGFRCARSP